MAVPKKKRSYSKKKQRQTSLYFLNKTNTTCTLCKSWKRKHHICLNCLK